MDINCSILVKIWDRDKTDLMWQALKMGLIRK